MSVLSRWTQRISLFGRDGLALTRAMYLAVPKATAASNATVLPISAPERIKAVLLEQSRQPSNNSVAISFLTIGKEIGLVKYWGLSEYLRQKQDLFPFASLFAVKAKPPDGPTSITTATNENTDSTAATNKTKSANSGGSVSRAKVAFMITSSMKHNLINTLGYEPIVVKGMTPQQASLVLHHRVLPESYGESISELEEKFLEEQQQEQMQMQTQIHVLQEKERHEREKRQWESNSEEIVAAETETAAITDATTTTTTTTTTNSNNSFVSSNDVTGKHDTHDRSNLDTKRLVLSSSSFAKSEESLSSAPALSFDNRLVNKNDPATEPPSLTLLPSSKDHQIMPPSSPFLAESTSTHNATASISTDYYSTNGELSATHENKDMDVDSSTVWYELVEIETEKVVAASSTAGSTSTAGADATSNEVRHGLYRSHEEAILTLETRQMIQNRRERNINNNDDIVDGIDIENYDDATTSRKASSFIVRPISEEELQMRS
mmetsp:Transcript_15325/g.31349  ORF Transcript_15325/g.31349 Transcript_15325/m.31349 type:complete len:493 (+) Transcript_15325:183-1661(+)